MARLRTTVGLVMVAFAGALFVACEEDDPEPVGAASATPSPTATATPTAALAPGEFAPEVLLYAQGYGLTPDEAKRRLDLETEMDSYGPKFYHAEPERFAGMWIEREGEFRFVVWYMGDESGLDAAREVADKAPMPVELRVGAADSDVALANAQRGYRELAAQLGLLRQEDMLSSWTTPRDGLHFGVTNRPDSEATHIEQVLSARMGVGVHLEVQREVPPFGTQPTRATADEPVARGMPADGSDDAATSGTLRRDGNCLYIEYDGTNDGQRRALIMFPYETEWDAAANSVVIRGVRLAVDQHFSGGGSGTTQFVETRWTRWGTEPDPGCETSSVWFLSPEIRPG